jgi:hypothetical protein
MNNYFIYLYFTTTKKYKIMNHLNQSDFKYYLNTLQFGNDKKKAWAEDDYGQIAEIDLIKEEIKYFNISIIDGVEYELTKPQKDQVINLIEANITAESEGYDDKEHGIFGYGY